MLSLPELCRAGTVIADRFSGHRLERIVQRNESSLVLSFYGAASSDEDSKKRHLVLSCAPSLGRVSEPAKVSKRVAAVLRHSKIS